MVRLIEDIAGMQTINQPLHMALGVFDGVHIGHQQVIDAAVKAARSDGGIVGVLTFDPHPIQVLAPHVAPRRILASLNHKRELLADLGVDVMIVVPFTEEFAMREAGKFLDDLLQACPKLKTLSIGEDWKFGKNRAGDLSLLKNFGDQHGIRICSTDAVMLDGERVSSTRIRQAIRDGNMSAVHTMLGREYTVLGTVVKGKQLGRSLGFPTANLRAHNEQLPCDGVWAVDVTLPNEKIVRGAGNLGVRPTVDGEQGRRTLEIHLIDFEGDLYGKDVEVRFLQLVRDEKRFDSLEALKDQIRDDVAFCQNLVTS